MAAASYMGSPSPSGPSTSSYVENFVPDPIMYSSGSDNFVSGDGTARRPMPLRVTFVRHGQTEGNAMGILQGQMNLPLTSLGKHQAMLLGTHLRNVVFTRAFTSDLCRARRTLRIVTRHLAFFIPTSVTRDRRLRERAYGKAQGRPVTEFKAMAAAEGYGQSTYLYRPMNAESYFDFVTRIEAFMNDLFTIVDNGKEDEGENVLIMTHGAFMTTLMRHLLNSPDKFLLINFDPALALVTPSNTGYTELVIDPVSPYAPDERRVFTFTTINAAPHLN